MSDSVWYPGKNVHYRIRISRLEIGYIGSVEYALQSRKEGDVDCWTVFRGYESRREE